MYLAPGIYENLVFGKGTKINEKGSLVIEMEKSNGGSLLDAVMSNKTISSEKSSFIVFPVKTLGYEKEKRNPADILKDILDYRDKFIKYGCLVAPEETVLQALGGSALFDGLGISPAEYDAFINKLSDQKIADKVLSNLTKKFLSFMEAQPTFHTVNFRHKFVRQSKKKHFSTIPWSYKSPVVEPMTIPAEQTKIVWTDAEIKAGKNDGTPAAADLAKVEVTKKSGLFNSGGQAAPKPGGLMGNLVKPRVEGGETPEAEAEHPDVQPSVQSEVSEVTDSGNLQEN